MRLFDSSGVWPRNKEIWLGHPDVNIRLNINTPIFNPVFTIGVGFFGKFFFRRLLFLDPKGRVLVESECVPHGSFLLKGCCPLPVLSLVLRVLTHRITRVAVIARLRRWVIEVMAIISPESCEAGKRRFFQLVTTAATFNFAGCLIFGNWPRSKNFLCRVFFGWDV